MERVKIWEQKIEIPTYEIGEPDKNPMFLEKRVYQGSSGKVYPHPVIDKIYDEKVNKTYRAVFLENEYLKIMVLPELGGRIQRATDKTNNYDFVYYNHVIKPALVGLAGPWISGGIEFNWPQHHRPSTFDPVQYKLQENEDGSATIWVSEIENMFRTKGMAGITLYPGKAYLEIKAQLYNRTNTAQTFLWWANPAVPANEHTQSVFPPDVYAVMDHGKRDVSSFPIATGTYYKQDYSAGVDISRYINIPVPTSYMAEHSDYNFVGGYDHKERAGILHVADHHISPGKKQWTWGCGEFGQAWDRNLTDEDGPYIELMTGCFTDNQPDFSWMEPYEEKTFTQYFMPYKGIGMIKNASKDCAISMDVTNGFIKVGVYATGNIEDASLVLTCLKTIVAEEEISLNGGQFKEFTYTLAEEDGKKLYGIIVKDSHGRELISYEMEEEKDITIPEPAKAAPAPEKVNTIEELYLYGLHIEQYRHATYLPDDYYLEGLKRDPYDIRINTAYGKLLISRCLFEEAEKYLLKAVKRATKQNPNPYDGEPYYYLGLTQRLQGKWKKAYDNFYKATWNAAWQDSGFYQLACIDCLWNDLDLALDHINQSLIRNYHNMKARGLKAAILRRQARTEEAYFIIEESKKIDPLDFTSMWETYFLGNKREDFDEIVNVMNLQFNSYIEIALDYKEAGYYKEAITILNTCISLYSSTDEAYPMLYYHMADCLLKNGENEKALVTLQQANKANSDYCFPHRMEDYEVLKNAINLDKKGAKAFYYLGNLLYDKKRYDEAISYFEISKGIDATFPTVHRNLAQAYYNKTKDTAKAILSLETAYHLNESDARVLMELDLIYKKTGVKFKERKALLEKHMTQTKSRDDLYIEYITILNSLQKHEEALWHIQNHKFHPWEGGEGKVSTQYLVALKEIAINKMKTGMVEEALTILKEAAGPYPFNLGEGKLAGAAENDIYYYMGLCLEQLGDVDQANQCFQKAAKGISEPAGMMYYNDQPPESIYFQGLALLKLEDEKEARFRFDKLVNYGTKHMNDTIKIEYFAVSLPDLQIFDEDLNKKNKVHCLFMLGLGNLGLGETNKGLNYLKEASEIDPNHRGILSILQQY